MKEIEFLKKLVELTENIRLSSNKHRISLEIYPKRSECSIEIRHYIFNSLKKWIILTNENMTCAKKQNEVINYILSIDS